MGWTGSSLGKPPRRTSWRRGCTPRDTGSAILHSGTVGATLTARAHGCRGLAVSIASAHPAHWATAADAATRAIAMLVASDEPLVLNLNVPDVAPSELHGMRRARLASF